MEVIIHTLHSIILKRLFVYIAFVSLVVFAACEPEETTFKGPYYVRFTDSTFSFKESYNKPILLAVHNVGPQLSEPVTVTYAISGSAREGIDYRIEGTRGSVTIPANQSSGNIILRLINNANNILESQNIVFTLLGVEPASLQVGQAKAGILGRRATFTIVDDCILSGSYTGVSTGSNVPISGVPVISDDCNTYTLTNWNVGFSTFPSVKADLSFTDNGDNTLTITKQVEDKLAASTDSIFGIGTVNPLNGNLTFDIQFQFRLDDGRDTVVALPTLTYLPER